MVKALTSISRGEMLVQSHGSGARTSHPVRTDEANLKILSIRCALKGVKSCVTS